MRKHLIYLALGSNLGDRETNLRLVVQKLPPVVEMVAVSRLYATAPAYVLDQPAFLNIAVKGRTNLSPLALLAYLKEIEADMGRQKTMRYGPRIIDVDIIFYNDSAFNWPNLQIPHPRMTERAFVLRPLADIAAEVVHPVLKETVADLLAALPAADGILTVTDW